MTDVKRLLSRVNVMDDQITDWRGWCEDCALPSRFAVQLWDIYPDGVTDGGFIVLCSDCKRHRYVPELPA